MSGLVFVPIAISIFSWLIMPFILFFILERFFSSLKSLPLARSVRAVALSQAFYGILWLITSAIAFGNFTLKTFLGLLIFLPVLIFEFFAAIIYGNIGWQVFKFLVSLFAYIISISYFTKQYLGLTFKQSFWFCTFIFICSLLCMVLLTAIMAHFNLLPSFD